MKTKASTSTLLAILLGLGSAIYSSQGQGVRHQIGLLLFQNNEPNRPKGQPASFHLVTNVDGTLLIGTQYWAELYYLDAATSTLTPLPASITPFYATNALVAGFWAGPIVFFPDGVGGVDLTTNGFEEIGDGSGTGPGYYPVTVRVRAWDSTHGSTWEAATGRKGESPDFVYTQRFSTPPIPADTQMINQPGFQLHLSASMNQAPVALCQDQVVPADASCTAMVSINHGSYDPDGDAIIVAQSPPGPYPIGITRVTLTVTDSHGASSQCAASVTVMDETPPTIVCPADVTTEFTSEAGAVVAFAPTVSDNCSAAVVLCVPPSGSVFPIGVTRAHCTVTNVAGNSASCAFTVAVLGSLGVKHEVLRDLTDLLPTVQNHDEQHKIVETIQHLAGSLQQAEWLDQTHVQLNRGQQAFDQDSVTKLHELLQAKHSSVPAPLLQAFIDRLVSSDRLLAVVAIDDAIRDRADRTKIRAAQQELLQGDNEEAGGKFQEGITRYQGAWREALLTKRPHLHRNFAW